MDAEQRRGDHELRPGGRRPPGASAGAGRKRPRRPAATAAAASRPTRTEHHRSAGGVVAEGDRILLISTQAGRRWQLPKGHIEAGETPVETAVREVAEETGVTGRVVAELPGVEYWFVQDGLRIHKVVDYFLLDYVSGDPSNFDPKEVSGAAWFPWDEGLARLSFGNEREVVRAAREAAAREVSATAARVATDHAVADRLEEA